MFLWIETSIVNGRWWDKLRWFGIGMLDWYGLIWIDMECWIMGKSFAQCSHSRMWIFTHCHGPWLSRIWKPTRRVGRWPSQKKQGVVLLCLGYWIQYTLWFHQTWLTGKWTIYRWFFPLKPPSIGDFPFPCLITSIVKWDWMNRTTSDLYQSPEPVEGNIGRPACKQWPAPGREKTAA